jgi:hypothetical protein
MPGETYGGPYFGDRTILVFDGSGNYLNRNVLGFTSDAVFEGITSATTEYVQAGGETFGTNAELRRFMASVFFARTNRRRDFLEEGKKSPSLSNVNNFATAATRSAKGVTIPPQSRTLSQIDPRSSHFLYLAATSGYFTADHGDEIQIKTTTGTTLQAYFGGSAEGGGTPGVSGGFTFGIYLFGVGRTAGVTGATGFVNITAGNSLENMNNGVTTSLVANPFISGSVLTPNIARTIVNFSDFRDSIIGQMKESSAVTNRVTSTFADSTSVSYNAHSKLLDQLQDFKTLVDANHKVYGRTAAAYIETIEIRGLSGATFQLSVTGGGGVTTHATPGSAGFTGSSEFDVVLFDAFNHRLITMSETPATNSDKLRPFTTIRELEQVDFLSL